MQGGAIELAAQAARLLETGNMPDAILATDMLNLPAWLALLRGKLPAQTPIVLYMHENQLTYPWRPGESRDLTYAMINWLSQLAADAVIFNSRYHYDAWFGELPNLLKHYPDYNHLRLIEQVQARSRAAGGHRGATDRRGHRPHRRNQNAAPFNLAPSHALEPALGT